MDLFPIFLFLPFLMLPLLAVVFIFLIFKFNLRNQKIGKPFFKASSFFLLSGIIVGLLSIGGGAAPFAFRFNAIKFFWTTIILRSFFWWYLFKKQKNLMISLMIFSAAHGLISAILLRAHFAKFF